MGLKLDRALREREAARAKLVGMYSTAIHFGLSHAVLCERVGTIWDHLNKVKAPHWVKAYIEGYRAALDANLYRDHLVFGGMVDGAFRSTYRDRDDYYEKHGIEPSAYADNGLVRERGHYWKENGWRAVRPFFIG